MRLQTPLLPLISAVCAPLRAAPHIHIVDLRGRMVRPGLDDSPIPLNLNLPHTSAAIARHGVYEPEGPARNQGENGQPLHQLESGKASGLLGRGPNRYAARPATLLPFK